LTRIYSWLIISIFIQYRIYLFLWAFHGTVTSSCHWHSRKLFLSYKIPRYTKTSWKWLLRLCFSASSVQLSEYLWIWFIQRIPRFNPWKQEIYTSMGQWPLRAIDILENCFYRTKYTANDNKITRIAFSCLVFRTRYVF
jgi:hypothetical protein